MLWQPGLPSQNNFHPSIPLSHSVFAIARSVTAIRQPGTIAKTSLYCDHVEILDTSYGIPLLSEYPNYRRNMVVVFVCNTWLSSAAKRRRFGRIVSCRPVTYWSGRRHIFLLVDRYKRPLFCCRWALLQSLRAHKTYPRTRRALPNGQRAFPSWIEIPEFRRHVSPAQFLDSPSPRPSLPGVMFRSRSLLPRNLRFH